MVLRLAPCCGALLLAAGAAGPLQIPHLPLQPRCGGAGEGRQRGGTAHSGSPALPGGPGPFLAWPSSAPSPSPSPDGSSPARLQTRPPAPTWDTASGQLLGCPCRARARAAACHYHLLPLVLEYLLVCQPLLPQLLLLVPLVLVVDAFDLRLDFLLLLLPPLQVLQAGPRGRGAVGPEPPLGGRRAWRLGVIFEDVSASPRDQGLNSVSTPFQRGEGSPSGPPVPPQLLSAPRTFRSSSFSCSRCCSISRVSWSRCSARSARSSAFFSICFTSSCLPLQGEVPPPPAQPHALEW